VVRTCGIKHVKFWKNRGDGVKVRVYRVPWDTDPLPIAHAFMHTDWLPLVNDQEPEEIPAQVGMYQKGFKYDKGATPPLWRPPTHYIGTEEQWQQGSEFPRHQPLEWCGGFSKDCKKADEPLDKQCLRACEQCPETSSVWLVDGFEDFGSLHCSAVCQTHGCEFSNSVVTGIHDSPQGTAAAWEVIMPHGVGPLTNGVVAFVGNDTWSTCCNNRKRG
jgi:hypothetical protein